MDKQGITLVHRQTVRVFFLSDCISTEALSVLIKKSFKTKRNVIGFRTKKDDVLELKYLVNNITLFNGQRLQILFDEYDSKNRRDYSPAYLLKASGRSAPPKQQQIINQKFFIKDFQLWLQEASSQRHKRLYGVIFFDDAKNAHFFGKKMLRDLIYVFGSIQFYYCLYPSKRSASSLLLGPTVLFSLFYGKHLLTQRQFCQKVSSSDQMIKMLHYLINSGQLSNKMKNPKSIRPLMPDYQKNLIRRQARQESILANRTMSNDSFSAEISKVQKKEQVQATPISNLRNELSFQNFSEEDYPEFLNELVKDLPLANRQLIKFYKATSSLPFRNFVGALDPSLSSLNRDLLNTYITFMWDKILSTLGSEQQLVFKSNTGEIIELLNKLGQSMGLQQFLDALKLLPNKRKFSFNYSEIATALVGQRHQFRLDRKDSQKAQELPIPSKQQDFQPLLLKVTEQFHQKQHIPSSQNAHIFSKLTMTLTLTEQQKQRLYIQLSHSNPFLSRILTDFEKSKNIVKAADDLRKLLYQESTLSDLESPIKVKNRLCKFNTFKSLIKYLLQENWISLKQFRALSYLYTWEDMNVLSAFQCYLLTADLKQFIQTVDIIQQNYYLRGRFGVDSQEIQKFSEDFEDQTAILFAFKEYLPLKNRKTLQKLMRAGDRTLNKLYGEYKSHRDRTHLIEEIIKYASQMQEKLIILKSKKIIQPAEQTKLKERCELLDKLKSKLGMPLGLIKVALRLDIPAAKAILELYESDKNIEELSQTLRILNETLKEKKQAEIVQGVLKRQKVQIKWNCDQNDPAIVKVREGAFKVLQETGDCEDFADTFKTLMQ